MRQFFLIFNDLEIWNTRVPNLTWSHFRTLLRVTNDDARYWYMREGSQEMWSVTPPRAYHYPSIVCSKISQLSPHRGTAETRD